MTSKDLNVRTIYHRPYVSVMLPTEWMPRAPLIEWVQDEIFKLTDKTVQSHHRSLLHTHYSKQKKKEKRKRERRETDVGRKKTHGHIAMCQGTSCQRTARTKSHSTAHIVANKDLFIYVLISQNKSDLPINL